jgi:hypothetical protein
MKERNRISARLSVPAALIFEDSREEATILHNLCKLAFERTADIRPIIGSASAGIDYFDGIAETLAEGCLVFLDVCLESDVAIHSGRRVAQHIREKRPDMPIIIYSMRGDLAVCMDLFANGLVDGVVDKDQILRETHSVLAFNSAVHEAISRRQERTVGPIIVEPSCFPKEGSYEEWLSFELLSRIGNDEVARLIAKCVEGATSARVEYMSPGFSGSLVARAIVERREGPTVDVVLKFDRNAMNLAADHRYLKDVGAIFGRVIPHLRPEGIQSGYAGWYAYAMERVTGKPLSDLLDPDSGPGLITSILDVLKSLYDNQKLEKNWNIFNSQWCTDSEKASILVELHRHAALIRRHRAQEATEMEAMKKFVMKEELYDKTLPEIKRILGELPAIYQHGDLHMNNIIVDKRNTNSIICLIDWARYGAYPLGTDFSRLESEFRLRVVGVADCTAFDLNNVPRWIEADNVLYSDINKVAPLPHDIGKLECGDCLERIRVEAQNQMNRCDSPEIRRRLSWWYYFSLFRNYLKAFSYGRIPEARRVCAFATAVRLGKNLAEAL